MCGIYRMRWFAFQVLKEVSSSSSEGDDKDVESSPDTSPLPETQSKDSSKEAKVETLVLRICLINFLVRLVQLVF